MKNKCKYKFEMNKNKKRIGAFALASCLVAGGVLAADAPKPSEDDGAQADPTSTHLPLGSVPHFYEDKRASLRVLAETQKEGRGPNDPSRAVQHLALAEDYFDKGLILEAWSFAKDIPDGALSPALATARLQLVAMATVLDPRPGAVPKVTDAAFETAPRRAVFQALAHARAGRAAEAAATLASHIDDLTALPVPIQARALPYLLLAAIEANDWTTSRALVLAFQDHPELAGSAAFSYLLGHTALENNERLRAFDHFAVASGSADKWGHRARLKMVDLAMAHGGITAAEQEHMLMRIYGAWRRGPEASDTLLRIEALQQREGNRLGALETLSALMTNHAGSPEAIEAQERARTILAEFYRRLIRPDADLNTVIEHHERIARDYRFFEGFDVFAEMFGDYLLSVGISGRAAQEYRLTGEYLSAAKSLGLFETPPERTDALRLKEAEALLEGGQIVRAKEILEQPPSVDAPRLAARLASLRAVYFARTGDTVSETETTTTAHPSGYIRELAEQYFEAEEWELARLEYLKLAQVLGDDLATPDAVNLFLAAERSGDTALSKVLGDLLAQRQDFDQATLAAELDVDATLDDKIRRRTLEAVVERADQVLTDIDALTNKGPADASSSQE